MKRQTAADRGRDAIEQVLGACGESDVAYHFRVSRQQRIHLCAYAGSDAARIARCLSDTEVIARANAENGFVNVVLRRAFLRACLADALRCGWETQTFDPDALELDQLFAPIPMARARLWALLRVCSYGPFDLPVEDADVHLLWQFLTLDDCPHAARRHAAIRLVSALETRYLGLSVSRDSACIRNWLGLFAAAYQALGRVDGERAF